MQFRRVSESGGYCTQLFSHELCDHLSIDSFRISPLDSVVRNFNYEAHPCSLTDAVIGEFLEVRHGVILA